MKNKHTPLMALAMAGIVAPAANAALITETTDWSNDGISPTGLGAFNLNDILEGTLRTNPTSDFADFVLVQTAHDGPISMNYASSDSQVTISVYDGINYFGPLLTSGGGNSGTLTFNPSGMDYVIGFQSSENSLSYSLEITAVPEASTTLPLMAVLGLAALLRSRKNPLPNL